MTAATEPKSFKIGDTVALRAGFPFDEDFGLQPGQTGVVLAVWHAILHKELTGNVSVSVKAGESEFLYFIQDVVLVERKRKAASRPRRVGPARPAHGARLLLRRRRKRRRGPKPGPRPTEHDLLAYLQKRESLRIRKEVLKWPDIQWTHDPVLKAYRFTNVFREDDRMTRVVRERLNRIAKRFEQPTADWNDWSDKDRRLASRLVASTAAWRAFGTKEFIDKMPSANWWRARETMTEAAKAVWKAGGSCFTTAYMPARLWRNVEVQAFKEQDLTKRRAKLDALLSVVADNLEGLFNNAREVASLASTSKSRQDTTAFLRTLPNFGGNGFRAKEIVQDLLLTPLLATYNAKKDRWTPKVKDLETWSAIGPGARRGLDRMAGRLPGKAQVLEEQYLQEMQKTFDFLRDRWPQEIDGVRTERLCDLHDVQFAFCELDKYLRTSGRRRKYVPTVAAEGSE